MSRSSRETGITATEGAPAPWEIWHARFNFDDRTYKFHPALVLACSQDRLLAAMTTSASNKLSRPLDTPLDDWQEAGLTKPTLVRVDQIALLPPTYLGTVGRIGSLSPRDAHRVSRTLATLTK